MIKEQREPMDVELVAKVRLGRRDAFDDLVRRHMSGVLKLCRRFASNLQEAEDWMQDAFVLAYRALDTFRGDANFQSWLYRIVLNLCRSRLRSRYREQRKLERLKNESPAAIDPEPRDQGDLMTLVRAKLSTLPDRQREVLILHLDHQMPYEQIAKTLGISYEDVKTNLSLARKRLRQELGGLLK